MDMMVDIDEEQLKKHNLELDRTNHVKKKECEAFNKLEEENEVEFIPGGCSYNTIRVFNWLLTHNPANIETTAVLGAVGNDKYGEKYENILKNETIIPLFERYDDPGTGTCMVYCCQKERGHLTDLGCSTMISESFSNQCFKYFDNLEMIYTELYILKSRRSIVFQLAEHCTKNGAVFGFNLPSHFFIEMFKDDIIALIGHGDVVYANKSEAIFFYELLTGEKSEDIYHITREIAKIDKKNKSKRRIVVVTCGPDPAYIVEHDFVLNEMTFIGNYAPEPIDQSTIVDTNGAGDAFAGGFLAKFVNGDPLDFCMRQGHKSAMQIIQSKGITLRKKSL